jgi:hypothetical protein
MVYMTTNGEISCLEDAGHLPVELKKEAEILASPLSQG